jgi:hypothetical protein
MMSESVCADAPECDRCVANIGWRQRQRRLVAGLAALAAVPVTTTILVLAGAARAWLLIVALPLWVAASGFFQYRDKT